MDNVYHRIAGISKEDGLITLEDKAGNTRLISPREAAAEGVTLYNPETIRVGAVTGCVSRRVTGNAGMWPQRLDGDGGFR
ncbi:Multifunctional conjugation protein TraI (plasmid) [Salmonella enterica subsp. enterica]|nr:Multifunctional conjugation protein TraI [Salmonella enterica subsp. enterica]